MKTLLEQIQFYGVTLRSIAKAAKFSEVYTREVLSEIKQNEKITEAAIKLLDQRKSELRNALNEETTTGNHAGFFNKFLK